MPTSLKVLGVTVLPNGQGLDFGCSGLANYGIMADIKYQVLDQNGNPIASASMIPHEHGTSFKGQPYDSDIGPSGFKNSTKTTAADGTFHDVPFGACANGAFSSFTRTQNITVIMGSTTGEGESEFLWVGAGNNCVLRQVTPTAPINVVVPTASRIVNPISSGPASCKSGQSGWTRKILKAVTDQNGSDIVLSGQLLDETVTITTPNQLNLVDVTTGTAVTDGANFTDTFFACSAKCPGTGQTDASQTITDMLPSGAGPYNLSPNVLVYKCSSITVNGN